MKKVRSNALWNGLTVEQRATLDKWLLEERLSITAAWERAQKEMGYKGSRASVHRYSKRRQNERVMTEFKDLRDDVAAIRNAPGDADESRAAAMKVLGQFLFRQVRQSPENVKEWGRIAQLLLQNDYNEVLRRTKAEEHRIRREAMAFAKEKFEFDMVEKALQALPQLRELAEARKDPKTKETERSERIRRIRLMMFGDEDEDEDEFQTPDSGAPQKSE
jgi:hypothetical protein